MKPDLKSMSRKELEKLKASIDKALDKLAAKDKKSALAAAQKAAAAHGFSLAEITGSTTAAVKTKAKPAAKKVSAPKYRDPADPAKTWTGKGRQPDWFKAAIANGISPETMEI